MIAVVDTSALLRLFIPDGPVPDGLDDLLKSAWRAEAVLMAPELMIAEAAHVLHKKKAARLLSPSEFKGLLNDILELPIRLYGHRDLLRLSSDIAHRHHLTIYDSLFLALAEIHRAPLFTADDKLGRAAHQMGLTLEK
ncbi:MAG: type II toxin-antitoxin system VapC family toxin [Elusimicrobia bacterium]|nr:type II toxin-antitoxin system VapC family toxin [Elusimicrobiota bacterium]